MTDRSVSNAFVFFYSSSQKPTPPESTDWDIYLDAALFSVWQAVLKSTSMTKYNIGFWREPKLPLQNEDQPDFTVANTALVDRFGIF